MLYVSLKSVFTADGCVIYCYLKLLLNSDPALHEVVAVEEAGCWMCWLQSFLEIFNCIPAS